MGPQRSIGLSKTVLEMKFMKRTKERVEREATVAAEAAEATGEGGLYTREITDEMRRGNQTYCIVESSFAACLDLLDGRRSYRGKNPEIERLTQQAENPTETNPNEADVSDKQMAQFYNPLVNTVQNKFKSKRENKKSNQSELTENSTNVNENQQSNNTKKRTNRSHYPSPKNNKKPKFLKPNV
ncbi:M-phase phosphoprotein 6 [Arctopsyche grandis]|uniref:M-phase phosphoprotein 6 n=1 Tax=Arctopsyche grandis TaxID=121162 RepID=UPI00406D7F11